MNNATLVISGSTGVLTVDLNGKTLAKKIKTEGGDWGAVMAQANREVEKLGVFVQYWNGETGDGTYRCYLGKEPMLFD